MPAAPHAHHPPEPAEPDHASALIFNSSGEYLLHLRDDIPGIWEPGCWSLLGGGREPSDATPEDTVRRELREEVGLELPLLEPFAATTAADADGTAVPLHVFAGHWEGDPDALVLTEGVMVRWFRPEVLPRLRLSPDTLDLVRRHAERGTAHRPGPAPEPDRSATHAFTVAGVHLYLEDPRGRLLLGLRRPDARHAGELWHFLAGHCERGESALECLVREADEEAGLRIRPQDAELVHVVHVLDGPGTPPRMQCVFRVRRWEGQPELREPDRCLAWRWWDPGRLPRQIVPYTRAAIDGVRAGRRYTELGW